MISDFNKNLNRDISLLVDGRPNGSLLVIDHCIKKYLDVDRSVLNVGAFTGRDLEWLLPICQKHTKPIECVENWALIESQNLKEKISKEVESLHNHPSITWTWDDVTNAKTLSSSDFFWITTTWNQFDLQSHMRSLNHPSIWMLNPGTISWGLKFLSDLLHFENIHYMFSSHDCFLFTNDSSIHTSFLSDYEHLNTVLKKHNQYLELCENHIRWRKKSIAGDMQFKDFVQSL